ncbi:MAG: CDF family Co(II)/Ni(II) efflux transporter DmeF [Candidatus Hydrogenedentes bacterium]|nr:CDF family Co(II)/Ni(II) efflux transporter DmeF [Candidatus Hydrogenedentota bacterium]
MNTKQQALGVHDHKFGQDRRRPGEKRTIFVVVITLVTMGVEIGAGLAFGSMALLADGLHMGSHAVALGIAVFAYVYTRRHARDGRFNFGTGKVNALGGFTGAILLVLFAVMMAWASLERLLFPVAIAFNQAILVAVAGLIVNGISVFILGGRNEEEEYGHHHNHVHGHEHGHTHDHNLRSAYLHVLADALTSVFAIIALLSGKYLGWVWMDPFMGIAGAVLVGVWSRGLVLSTTRVLLDMQAPDAIVAAVRNSLEQDGEARVTDLHVWSIGPCLYAAAINLVTSTPRQAEYYHDMIPPELGLVHVTIEVIQAEGAWE